MKTNQCYWIGPCLAAVFCVAGPAVLAATAPGPLRVSAANPRYFADANGQVIYLTGAHTWNNLQDMGPTDPPAPFDFEAYLDFLDRRHHNFVRLWRWELVSWNTAANREKESQTHICAPHPWARIGPGPALDGKPKFDLTQFDEAFFQRLRARVQAAANRGIYVSIMLFEGWGLQFVENGWKAHPFHPANNVNGIDGDPNGDGKGVEIHTLGQTNVTRLQEAYVRKVIDTVNDLDNVLYEISNENHPDSTQWQYHVIRYIHRYEKTKPKQHPVGMTFQYKGGSNSALFDSPADWISPNPNAAERFDYRTNPPAGSGAKVILSDTDHLWGIGGDIPWVWKSFLRGLNPIFMDPYDRKILNRGSEPQWEAVRRSLGDTRRFANRMDLAAMPPRPELASTGYCLAKAGSEYLVYQPKPGEPFSVELAAGVYRYEWFDPEQGAVSESGDLTSADGQLEFRAPDNGSAVLYLLRSDRARSTELPKALPVRGLHVSAPGKRDLPAMLAFIREVLPKEGVNTLIVEFNFSFDYRSRPEFANPSALDKDAVRQILAACRENGIELIPQINCLGHQSWSKRNGPLLEKYPEFDETPGKHPGNEGIYCRSYCPLHPEVHDVLFDLIDELAAACQARSFHAGMDEVFILADPDCPRCRGKNPADLFAREVRTLHAHLKEIGCRMWMWGDRFLDGSVTQLGKWEASMNDTAPAVDWVPKDILICDWHYERPPETPQFFAAKGFDVVACPWRKPKVALAELAHIENLRRNDRPEMAGRALGVVQTTWCGLPRFAAAYNALQSGIEPDKNSASESAHCFKTLFQALRVPAPGNTQNPD